jgi:hypothetical protein
VISLDAIAAGEPLTPLSRDEIVAVMHLLSAAQTRVAAWFAQSASAMSPAQGEDHLVDALEAARRLSVKRPWLYRRSKSLPFLVRLEGKVLYSAHGIDEFLAAKRKGER